MASDDDPPVEGMKPHHADAAERLERVIDVQIATVNGIDEKAEHVTRLVGILLGVVLSVLSLSVRFGIVDLSSTMSVTILAFGIGVSGLFGAMVAAIVTYLGSRVRIGLDHQVGRLFSAESYSITTDEYGRRVLGTYGYNVRRNERVVAANSRRFRRSLLLLLVGVVYLTLSVLLSVGRTASRETGVALVTPGIAGVTFLWTTLLVLLTAGYVLSGRYLTLGPEGGDDD